LTLKSTNKKFIVFESLREFQQLVQLTMVLID